ncbi:MAG: N-acetyltransferase [Candidatus Thorarchaeota archaeon]|nr:MAG: N-acetyltransferase [Candidatus Thorarchaeota archaeon]
MTNLAESFPVPFLGAHHFGVQDCAIYNERLGIAIHSPQDWEKGYGSEAIQLLLDFGWKHLNLRRIELSVFAFNERAKHVYEKLGFKEWGIAHKIFFIEGEYHDAHYMEIFRNND